MDDSQKTVRDPIHGNIQLKKVALDLLETPEIQRLYDIKQLGFAHLVFPGAHHTRLEHSLGTYYITQQLTTHLNLGNEETQQLICAALLHDIGHGPFSHTLESLLLENYDVDHIDLTEELIQGTYDIFEPQEKQYIHQKNVNEVLTNHNIDLQTVTTIIKGETSHKPYLGQILNHTIDVDQLDYLIRDAYYTGVVYGIIDINRFLQTITTHNNNLAIQRKGISVIENILMARSLMYATVYFHKTVRIAELMLSKALEKIKKPFDFFRYTDSELTSKIKQMGTFQHEIITRLKYRKLFKQAFTLSALNPNPEYQHIIKSLENIQLRQQTEQELEQTLHIPKGHVIIDIPRPELLRAEPRITKADITVLDNDDIKQLDQFTPLAEVIRSRITPDWSLMIITDERFRNVVAENALKIVLKVC